MPKQACSGLGPATFIQVGDPTDGSWRNAVRSQAATARHAAARKQRLLEYQRETQSSDAQGALTETRFTRDAESLGRIRGLDPFDTLARPTTRFECFLMNHFMKHLMWHAKILIDADVDTIHRTGMTIGWARICITDGSLLNALFLSTCRNLVELGATGDYFQKACEYRDQCIRTVNKAISQDAEVPSTNTIFIIVALALDALKFGDLAAAKKHCDAINVMLQIQAASKERQDGDPPHTVVPWLKFVTNRIMAWPHRPISHGV